MAAAWQALKRRELRGFVRVARAAGAGELAARRTFRSIGMAMDIYKHIMHNIYSAGSGPGVAHRAAGALRTPGPCGSGIFQIFASRRPLACNLKTLLQLVQSVLSV